MPASWPVVRITPSPRVWPSAARVGWLAGPGAAGTDHRIGGCRRLRSGWSAPVARTAPIVATTSEGVGVRGSDVRRAVARTSGQVCGGCIGLDPGAGQDGRSGTGAGPGHRQPGDESVLCVAGVVEVPGGDRDLGPHPAHGDRLSGSGDASVWRRCDVTQRSARSRTITSLGSGSGDRWVGGHYGITVATCARADPESKGGSEATVRIAEADLGPRTRLRATTPAGPSWSRTVRRSPLR